MRAFRGFTLPEAARRHPAWFAVSVAAHLVVIGLIIKAYSGFRAMQEERRAVIVAVPVEAPPSLAEAPPPPRSRALIAPSAASVPVTVTPASVDTFIAGGDTAGVVGGRGRRGLAALSPGGADRRLYSTRPMYLIPGTNRPIEMDSMVRGRLLEMAAQIDAERGLDSFGFLRPQYLTPSWTVERDGKTYGIDQQFIHFGTFKIPTAILALLPFPQGNIDQARANARIADMRSELLRAAARSEAEEDFRRAVNQIRERRQREREQERERERRQSGEARPIN